MTNFLIYIVNGALIGLLYALVATGFVIIYRCSRVLNLAQGEILVIGAFLTWTFLSFLNMPIWISLLLSFIISALFGLLVERIILRPLVGEEIFALVMVTIGLLIFLRGSILVIWGAEVRFFPVIFPVSAIKIGQIILDGALVIGGCITIFLGFTASYFFNHTRMGLEMTAIAEDHQIALSLGLSVKKSVAIAWAISGVLSTLAATIYLNGRGMTFLASDIGFGALPVALLAGLESIGGLVLGGLIVGISLGVAGYFLDPIFQGGVMAVFPFVIMVLVLLIKPSGLFGWKTIERV
jgi:branched-chain amino acid transport system permease protein